MRTTQKITQTTFLCFAIAITFITTGYGGSADKISKRYNVSGTVTFEGKPVPFGIIIFTPNSSKGNKGPQGLAEIVASSSAAHIKLPLQEPVRKAPPALMPLPSHFSNPLKPRSISPKKIP